MDKKKKNIALIGISVINLIVILVVYSKLKSMIPINVFASSTIEKMASKQLILILPCLSIIISIFQVMYRMKTIDKPVTTGKIIEDGLFSFFDGLIMFISWILVYIGYEYTNTTLVKVEIQPIYIIMGVIGLGLAGMYSTFPINKIGSAIGLTTKETIADAKVWRIANRFNALTGFICAVAIVMLSIYFMFFGFNWIYLVVLLVACVLLMYYVPRLYAKKVAKDLSEKVVSK